MNALVTLRESRERMNKMRTARGFFKGNIEGMLDESTAAGGKPKKGKGKGKEGKRCGNCGRMDHATADCPNPKTMV